MENIQPKVVLTRQDLLLGKLQAMSEADFTKRALIPLFKSMGYQVDYHGGPAEGGKDLICRKGGDFGFQEVGVIQVKKTTASAAVGRSNSFAGIVSQLQQAAEKKVPSLSGQKQLPNYVYFITPYEIDTRALESRFEAMANSIHRGLRILDGRVVVEELIKKTPQIADEICGESFVMKDKLLSNLSNADLLSALNYSNEKRIADFYCDLDFGVGRVTTKSLFAMEFSSKTTLISIPSNRWHTFEKLAQQIQPLIERSFLTPSLSEVKRVYKRELELWRSPANQSLLKLIEQLRIELEDVMGSFLEKSRQIISDAMSDEIILKKDNTAIARPNRKIPTAEESARLNLLHKANTSLGEAYQAWIEASCITLTVYDKVISTVTACAQHVESIRADISILKATAPASLQALLKDVAILHDLQKALGVALAKRVVEPNYEVQIFGDVLVDGISIQRAWMTDAITKLSNGMLPTVEVRSFFLRCQDLFEALNHMFNDRYFAEVMGARPGKELCALESSQRISMPLREVFATGIHCAVFGEAGAGKSTTLYQYAAYASANDSESELTLFVPLTRILAEKMLPISERESSPIRKLENCLAAFLADGKNSSAIEIVEFIRDKSRVTFIFDGVDEVIKRAPWIIDAIVQIEHSYKNSQIILSSRTSGTYADDIKYLGLTLLPFTDEQVNHFVRGWFVDRPSLADEVEVHLACTIELREIVRSPLLATILCVLAENKVPLPNGEISMFAERFKLLLGHYDIHKRTARVESHHSLLENVSRKLAFHLHSRSLRAAAPEELEGAAIRIFSKNKSAIDPVDAVKAVKELHDPCNVLMPMTADGDFGFGHLRYQEYLCASELRVNRGIDLAPLLASPWWRSVLVLFAQMTDDIAYVINDVLEKGLNVTRCRENLLAMIATRADRAERRQLTSLIEAHAELDRFDQNLKDYENSESDGDW